MATAKKDSPKGPQKPITLAVSTKGSAGTKLPANVSQKKMTKKLDDTDIFLIKCPKCGSVHFRHAGYVEMLLPYVDPKEGAKLADESLPVKMCVKCKTTHVIHRGKIIDLTDHIDVDAWVKSEKEAQAATGPGGQC